ncbi:hypothetical protein L1987_08631 [Smallanthus sonchifolius]|uniref:Uncharacterized protein n=1 Tax=Smallanthus sonchifolius TaxID=185202 RepID=A0ACB9JNE6_9ASTR|nr:hypothetical protein L1987_08631 [Smallanthus sonchifolius]
MYVYIRASSHKIPKNVTIALQDSNWIGATQEELLQFKKLNVWHLVALPEGKYPISTKWVFRNKKDDRGIVVRNKARLVVQGFYQEEGLDYDDVFAPVAQIEAIRIFLAYASFMKFKVYQMDGKTAFLYGVVKEEVYVNQPPGFEDPDHPFQVYKLDKALYGLHQAPRAWYETLSTHLTSNGFVRRTIDKTLFLKKIDSDLLIVQVYVDDIVYGSTNENLYREFETVMKLKFEVSLICQMQFFLGLQVEQSDAGILIHQTKYVKDILTKFNMSDCKATSTPIAIHKPLTLDPSGVEVNQKFYRSMIGSFMYLTASRPDIMYAVCSCVRYQSAPKESHESAVKTILQYLKGRVNLGLWYPSDSEFNFHAYTDSDYADGSGENLGWKPGNPDLICSVINTVCIYNPMSFQFTKSMNRLKFEPRHNIYACLTTATKKSRSYEEIVHFLSNSRIHTTISTQVRVFENQVREFWDNVKYRHVNKEIWIESMVGGKTIKIVEQVIREVLNFRDSPEFPYKISHTAVSGNNQDYGI